MVWILEVLPGARLAMCPVDCAPWKIFLPLITMLQVMLVAEALPTFVRIALIPLPPLRFSIVRFGAPPFNSLENRVTAVETLFVRVLANTMLDDMIINVINSKVLACLKRLVLFIFFPSSVLY